MVSFILIYTLIFYERLSTQLAILVTIILLIENKDN